MTDSTINQVGSAPKAIIDFWSPTCGPCMAFKPVFEDVASSSEILMATINADESPQAVATYNIQALPTILFLANGTEVDRVEGKMTKEAFLAEISKAFGDNTQPQVAPMPSTPSSPPETTGVQEPSTPSAPAVAPGVQEPSTPSAPRIAPGVRMPPSPAPAASPAAPTLLWGLGGLAAVGLVGWLILRQ